MNKSLNNFNSNDLKSPKTNAKETQSLLSVLQGMDQKIDSYSHRTQQLLFSYSSKKKTNKDDAFVEMSSNADSNIANRIKVLIAQYDKAEERTINVLSLLAKFKEKS